MIVGIKCIHGRTPLPTAQLTTIDKRLLEIKRDITVGA